MRAPAYFVLGLAFIGFAVAVWAGLLFLNLPHAGYLRLMIGLVLALMGVYRCMLALFPPPDHSSGREDRKPSRWLR